VPEAGFAGDAVRGAETLFAWRLVSSRFPSAHFFQKKHQVRPSWHDGKFRAMVGL
jgi:hypothetical protein